MERRISREIVHVSGTIIEKQRKHARRTIKGNENKKMIQVYEAMHNCTWLKARKKSSSGKIFYNRWLNVENRQIAAIPFHADAGKLFTQSFPEI